MKILIATGGSKHSDDAVHTGAVFAGTTNSPVTILNVVKHPGEQLAAQAIIDQAVDLAEQVLEESLRFPARPRIETKIRLGHPAEEIINEAFEGNFSLIVVGTWPKQNLINRLLAPTTERVIVQSQCPVLVARGKMGPLQRVLLCVSGADSPSRAVFFLRDLAAMLESSLEITVLHVMSQISASPEVSESWQLEASAEELIRKETPEGQWLRREIEMLERTRSQVQPIVRHGLVVDEVLAEALSGNCDLLVIGAHRRVGWQRYLLDDLTHQIVVRADRPVLIV